MLRATCLGITVWLLGLAPTAFADLTATIEDTTGDIHSITTAANSSFNIIVRLSTTTGIKTLADVTKNLTSGQFKIKEVTASPSGFFSITARSFYDDTPSESDPAYEWSNNPDDMLPASIDMLGGIAAMDLDNPHTYQSDDIGTLSEDPTLGTGTPLAIGSSDFAFITVQVSNSAAPGTYKLNLADLVFGDTDFDEITAGAKYGGLWSTASGQDYLISIIPAPAAATLGIVGIGIMIYMRRRSRQGTQSPQPIAIESRPNRLDLD